jgi:hypothetical protein
MADTRQDVRHAAIVVMASYQTTVDSAMAASTGTSKPVAKLATHVFTVIARISAVFAGRRDFAGMVSKLLDAVPVISSD